MRRPPAVVLSLALALALAGCGASRGVMITGDGRLVGATAENYRAEAERAIADALQPVLVHASAARVAIAELPRYGSDRRDAAEGWYWPVAHVVVTVTGEADEPRIVAAVRDALGVGIADSRALRVNVIHVALGGTPTAAEATPGPVPGCDTPPTPDARICTARAGDTLAELSTAYYGTPDEWRAIRDANPWIDFAALRGGERIVIPAKPAGH